MTGVQTCALPISQPPPWHGCPSQVTSRRPGGPPGRSPRGAGPSAPGTSPWVSPPRTCLSAFVGCPEVDSSQSLFRGVWKRLLLWERLIWHLSWGPISMLGNPAGSKSSVERNRKLVRSKQCQFHSFIHYLSLFESPTFAQCLGPHFDVLIYCTRC